MDKIFLIIVLVFSAVFHEYMHGYAAFRLGDMTAKNAGRLTLNPLKHLEWLGSVFLPLIMVISGAPFIFAWAKPVPYNPFNLRDRKYGDAKVGASGPLANLMLALAFGLILRFAPIASPSFAGLLSIIVYVNLMLMVFNLIPIPPLDGSKIVSAFLPAGKKEKYLAMERYGFIMVIAFIMLLGDLLIIPVNILFNLIVGV